MLHTNLKLQKTLGSFSTTLLLKKPAAGVRGTCTFPSPRLLPGWNSGQGTGAWALTSDPPGPQLDPWAFPSLFLRKYSRQQWWFSKWIHVSKLTRLFHFKHVSLVRGQLYLNKVKIKKKSVKNDSLTLAGTLLSLKEQPTNMRAKGLQTG